ncbi:MAG: DUF4286 family protein [Bacteroidota bacterium]
MITYSVTVTLESVIESDWLRWMQTQHIPDMMSTGFFEDFAIRRLLDPAPDPGSSTFNMQYSCKSMKVLQQYQATAAKMLQAEHEKRYRGRYAAFRTILEEI